MTYNLVRDILGVLVFGISVFFARKFKPDMNRFLYIPLVFAGVFVATGLKLVPFENAFVTFESPEKAYAYSHAEPIDLVVAGDSSDFIVGGENNAFVCGLARRSGDGWKVTTGMDLITVSNRVMGDISVSVYRCRGTEDYYISAIDSTGASIEITDNLDSPFASTVRTIGTQGAGYTSYYTHVSAMDESYTLTLNGTDLKLLAGQ